MPALHPDIKERHTQCTPGTTLRSKWTGCHVGQKKQKAHTELVAGLSAGDEVLTAGGILGKITGVSEHYAVVKISDNTEIKIQKSSVSLVVPKGTYDEA